MTLLQLGVHVQNINKLPRKTANPQICLLTLNLFQGLMEAIAGENLAVDCEQSLLCSKIRGEERNKECKTTLANIACA